MKLNDRLFDVKCESNDKTTNTKRKVQGQTGWLKAVEENTFILTIPRCTEMISMIFYLLKM